MDGSGIPPTTPGCGAGRTKLVACTAAKPGPWVLTTGDSGEGFAIFQPVHSLVPPGGHRLGGAARAAPETRSASERMHTAELLGYFGSARTLPAAAALANPRKR